MTTSTRSSRGTGGSRTAAGPDATRRERIVSVATKLFADRGFDVTGVGDIAAEAHVGAATIYTDVGDKRQLLTEIVLGSMRDALAELAGLQLGGPGDAAVPTDAMDKLAGLSLKHRHLGVLWQRETRYLDPDARGVARGLIRQFGSALTARVCLARPELGPAAADLIAWALIAVMNSPSFHQVDVSTAEYRRCLADMLGRVLAAPIQPDLPPTPTPTSRPADLTPASRREALLIAAVRLFAARGYGEVGLEDIGAAVGISGPSVYHHFSSKLELLTTAFQRGAAVLQADLAAAYIGAASSAEAFEQLLSSYLRFAFTHHELLSALITDAAQLPPEGSARALQAERDYFGEWVHLLQQIRRDVGPAEALIQVHAAVDVINNAARIAHLRTNPAAPSALLTLCRWMLRVA